ncbi:unnamed protein product [Urochloa humidicola]
MHPQQTPIPRSNPRRQKPPSILSPAFKRSAFPATATATASAATAAGGQDAAVSEHPCVSLSDWWLAKVEGDDERIAVAGIFERCNTFEDLAPALIAKRHEPCVLETEDGIVLLIYGSPNVTRTLAYGYSSQVCEKFMLGFPYWWQSYNQLYPKEETSSNARCPLSSSNKSNSKVDSKLFYLQMYQVGERLHSYGSSLLSKLNSVNSPSNIYAAFQKSSHLPNGAPRFEECASNGHDVPNSSYLPNENAAASNNDGEGDEAVCVEVDNVETDLTSAVECANDASNEEYASNGHDVPNSSYLPNENAAASNNDGEGDEAVCVEVDNVETDLTSAVECANDASNGEYASNGHDVPNSSCLANENAAASNNDGERDEAVCIEVDNVETDLTSAVECANDASNEEADTAPFTSDKRTPMVSLKMQGEEIPTSVCLDVQISSNLSNETPRFETNTCIGDIPTNGDAAASNDNSERCTTVPVISVETVLIVDSDIRERGHDDITTNVSLAPTAECINDAANEGVHNNSLLGCKQTPVASLKSQSCQEKQTPVASNEKPSGSGPPKKKRSAHQKLQGATRSPFTSPVPYAHESPLTRGRITSLSMSTPEALKLRKTRSGRVVVPSLDAGCQRIVYDNDGTITGVIGLDSPSTKGSKLKASATKKSAELAAASKLKTYARKKSAEPAAASKLKTYARKKRRVE